MNMASSLQGTFHQATDFFSRKAHNMDDSDHLDSCQHVISSFKQIKDEVLPPLSEIMYCIKKKLVGKKDLILFKLILDLHEAMFNQ